MEERFSLDVVGACSRISTRQPRPSVLVLHGACDPICEASDAAQLAGDIAGGVVGLGWYLCIYGRMQQRRACVSIRCSTAGRQHRKSGEWGFAMEGALVSCSRAGTGLVAVRVLLLHGACDPIFEASNAAQLAASIAGGVNGGLRLRACKDIVSWAGTGMVAVRVLVLHGACDPTCEALSNSAAGRQHCRWGAGQHTV